MLNALFIGPSWWREKCGFVSPIPVPIEISTSPQARRKEESVAMEKGNLV
jgi:hypothetical protein